jgi:hypothetical protein
MREACGVALNLLLEIQPSAIQNTP